MRRRLQNKIAESSVTLPAACVVATLLWWLPQGGYSAEYLLGWLACALTTYLVMETAAVNAMLRIRSRMLSSLFLFMMAAYGFLHPLQSGAVTLLLMAFAIYCFLRTYEKSRPEVDTLHAYLFLSLGSLLWPPLLMLVLVFLWSQAVYLRSLSMRSLGAALIGIVLPYGFWATGAFALGNITPFVEHATAIIAPVRLPVLSAIHGEAFLSDTYLRWLGYDAGNIPVAQNSWEATIVAAHHTDWQGFVQNIFCWLESRWPQCSALALTLLFAVTGFVHYVRQSYDDKIRVRMCYYSFMVMQVVIVVWLFCQPHYFAFLFPLLVLSTVPMAAHFIALTRTWLTNVWVIVLGLALVAVAVCCLALPQHQGWPLPSTDMDFPQRFAAVVDLPKWLEFLHLPFKL